MRWAYTGMRSDGPGGSFTAHAPLPSQGSSAKAQQLFEQVFPALGDHGDSMRHIVAYDGQRWYSAAHATTADGTRKLHAFVSDGHAAPTHIPFLDDTAVQALHAQTPAAGFANSPASLRAVDDVVPLSARGRFEAAVKRKEPIIFEYSPPTGNTGGGFVDVTGQTGFRDKIKDLGIEPVRELSAKEARIAERAEQRAAKAAAKAAKKAAKAASRESHVVEEVAKTGHGAKWAIAAGVIGLGAVVLGAARNRNRAAEERNNAGDSANRNWVEFTQRNQSPGDISR